MAKRNNTNLTGAFDLFPKSANIVLRNIKIFGLLFLLPFLSSLASVVDYNEKFDSTRWSEFGSFSGVSGLPTYAIAGLVGLGIIFFILFIVVAFILQAITTAAELEGAKGKTLKLGHIFELAKKCWARLFEFYLLYFLMIFGGLILLIVPGLIVLRRYALAPYIIVDKDVSVSEAMKESATMTKPYSSYIWSIFGVGVLIGLIGVVPIFGALISFVLGTLYTVAFALRYQELKKLS